ncbi:hypothetical protein ACFZB9_04990 [Kitasatospora sp. NPDC008050]|uniref:hypothetical protein n=1 Tax=Kitasatospora sp. NPDC008050 TaxID=3364021 RepID=UPI0036EC4240
MSSALDAQLVDAPSPSFSPSPSPTPAPETAALSGAFISTLGGNAGIPAVAGGLVVAAGGGALWLKRRRAPDKESG